MWDAPTNRAGVDEGMEDESDGEDPKKMDEDVVAFLPALHRHHGGAVQQLDAAQHRGIRRFEANNRVDGNENEGKDDLDNILEHEEQIVKVRTAQGAAYFLTLSVSKNLLCGEVSWQQLSQSILVTCNT